MNFLFQFYTLVETRKAQAPCSPLKSVGEPATVYLPLEIHLRVDKHRWIETLEGVGAGARQQKRGCPTTNRTPSFNAFENTYIDFCGQSAHQ
ncbi:hypothetical protein BKP35_06020 [Anaerobacillus arseniciselenatis]|uniref:Uncharacterized protein n=1 Tax=Anaerobacillus arseniciselenatis TaxID=85682 RepID=A0A1S2LR56_9BACI|nr:hypothetical protein BKP35_06020 [Anaerobacillus arseniciselenatis]